MTDEDWEELGRDISNNTHLNTVTLIRALNDHNTPLLFRGLTRSSSIEKIFFSDNALSVVGARAWCHFYRMQAISHTWVSALRDSPIETLNCDRCGIELIEIDNDNIPKHLTFLNLSSNFTMLMDVVEAKLLQGGDATLTNLKLCGNKIDDAGVEILVDALQNNTSLTTLNLLENDGISIEGQIKLLKLVNDISSIEATLQSNHTLKNVYVDAESGEEIQAHIFLAKLINEGHVSDQEAAGREKCIQTQLNSKTRAQLCRLQGVDHSVFSGIDPLHLPEVLSLIGGRHDCEELYLALKASIMTLFSTMNREKCIQQKMEYHAAKSAEYEAMAAGGAGQGARNNRRRSSSKEPR
eukprot:scaffold8687_cov85-Skeletonema_dohrnii-CCMP3373.AAC.1